MHQVTSIFLNNWQYMAPEIMQKEHYTKKVVGRLWTLGFFEISNMILQADIYSLGITINELLTGNIPYSDVKTTDLQVITLNFAVRFICNW